jgi:hypothetical protein
MKRSCICESILKKWADRDSELIRFLNGNLCYVDVEDAMVNFDTWVTNWDTVLTEEEKLLIQDDSW